MPGAQTGRSHASLRCDFWAKTFQKHDPVRSVGWVRKEPDQLSWMARNWLVTLEERGKVSSAEAGTNANAPLERSQGLVTWARGSFLYSV